MRRVVSRAPPLPVGALLLLATLVAHPPVLAYPISPVTLWDLVERSELIVLADVERVAPLPALPDGGRAWNSSVARLRLVETWKGRADAVVEVDYPANMICPAPPVYDPGHRVLAFLAPEEGRWDTVGLSYGTRYPEGAADVDALRAAVQEALVLQDPARPQPLPASSKRQWQLRLVAHDATRWDGLYGLLPAADERHARYDQRGPGAEKLSSKEQAAMARAFVSAPPVDGTLPLMLRALRENTDREVTEAAISAFDAALKARHFPWWAEETLPLIRDRLGKGRPLPAGDPLEQTFKDTATANWKAHARTVEEGVQREWFELKRELKLDPRPLPHAPDENRTRAVGGNTSL